MNIPISKYPSNFIPSDAEPFVAVDLGHKDQTATVRGFVQNGIIHIQEIEVEMSINKQILDRLYQNRNDIDKKLKVLADILTQPQDGSDSGRELTAKRQGAVEQLEAEYTRADRLIVHILDVMESK